MCVSGAPWWDCPGSLRAGLSSARGDVPARTPPAEGWGSWPARAIDVAQSTQRQGGLETILDRKEPTQQTKQRPPHKPSGARRLWLTSHDAHAHPSQMPLGSRQRAGAPMRIRCRNARVARQTCREAARMGHDCRSAVGFGFHSLKPMRIPPGAQSLLARSPCPRRRRRPCPTL